MVENYVGIILTVAERRVYPYYICHKFQTA